MDGMRGRPAGWNGGVVVLCHGSPSFGVEVQVPDGRGELFLIVEADMYPYLDWPSFSWTAWAICWCSACRAAL